MKKIEINIPTSIKEARECIISKLKWLTNPVRRKHNAKVLRELDKKICSELKSGYWSKDISDYMRDELTRENGKITLFISEAFKELR